MREIIMKPHNGQGKLITFCGLDGCGKSTMIEMLQEKLNTMGVDTSVTKQPTNAVRKSKIFRNYMDSPNNEKYEYRALSLMAASDRIQHSNQNILPEIIKGKTVISDRYIYSCLANLRARGYKRDKWIYEIIKDIPRPDLAFFLDVPENVAIERVRERAEEKNRYIDTEFQRLLRKEYIEICKASGGILIQSDNGVEAAFEEILSYVQKLYTTNDEVESKVYKILEDIIGARIEADGSVSLADISVDSLRMVMILVEIESKFGIQLNDTDMNPLALKTVDDVISLARKYVSNDNI